MTRKHIFKILCIAFLLLLMRFLANTQFEFTPKDWRFSWAEPWILYGAGGEAVGVETESHIGPIVIRQY